MLSIHEVYAAAARSGLLTAAEIGGTAVPVDFRAPDMEVLGGLGLSADYSIRYPAEALVLVAGDALTIKGNAYRVREVRAMGDGTECHATLTRVT